MTIYQSDGVNLQMDAGRLQKPGATSTERGVDKSRSSETWHVDIHLARSAAFRALVIVMKTYLLAGDGVLYLTTRHLQI